MKLLSLGLFFSLVSFCSAEALELKPLKPYVAEVLAEIANSDKKEPSLNQMAYVGRRCSALYYVMHAFVNGGAVSDEDKKMAQTIKERSAVFLRVAHAINKRSVGASDEFVKNQIKQLADSYVTMMSESKILNNDLFSPFVRADVQAAMEIYPIFEAFLSSSDDE